MGKGTLTLTLSQRERGFWPQPLPEGEGILASASPRGRGDFGLSLSQRERGFWPQPLPEGEGISASASPSGRGGFGISLAFDDISCHRIDADAFRRDPGQGSVDFVVVAVDL